MKHSIAEEIATLVGYQPTTANHTLLANKVGELIRVQILEEIEKLWAKTTNHSYNGVYNDAVQRAINIVRDTI